MLGLTSAATSLSMSRFHPHEARCTTHRMQFSHRCTSVFMSFPFCRASPLQYDYSSIFHPQVLQHKRAVVNRAPIMTAWSCIVAERLGFSREEALSIGECRSFFICLHSLFDAMRCSLQCSSLSLPFAPITASVYTEMNAVSKGTAIGIYSEGKKSSGEVSQGGSQPYVDLMGRRWVSIASSPYSRQTIPDIDLTGLQHNNVRRPCPHFGLTNSECT
jgi:hypothetical protein